MTFIASNPEPVAGLFNISFRTEERARDLLAKKIQLEKIQVRGSGGDKFSMDMRGRGMDADDIKKIVFYGAQ